MRRKLSLTCMVVAALAALGVGASTASAVNDPQLTTKGGALVPVGTSNLTATQVGETALLSTSGAVLISCSTGTGTGAVVKNSGGTVEGEITSLKIGGTGTLAAGEPANECTGSFGNLSVTAVLPWCLRSTPTMATDEMQVVAGKCPGTGNVKFLAVSTTAGTCEYEAVGPIKFDFLTSPNDAQATVRSTAAGSGVKLIKGGFLCPSSAMLKGTRTLEDTSGNPLFVS
jgi:hypothetical protein